METQSKIPSPQVSSSSGQQIDKSVEPSILLRISLGAEIIVDVVNLKTSIKSKLVGMEQDNFLLVKLAPNDLIGTFRSELVTKSPVIAKYQYKDIIYGFHTEILNIVSSPCKLIFLAYPKKIEEFKINPNVRHECALFAMAMLGNEIIEMVIVDISKEGCQCVIKASGARNEMLSRLINIDTSLEIRTQFPGTEEKFRFIGKVRNLSKDIDKLKIGIMFEEVSPEVRSKLDSFISVIHGK